MKHIIISSILLSLSAIMYGQQHPEMSNALFNPTVPRLINMQHKSVSYTIPTKYLTIKDIETKEDREQVTIYIVYEKDPTVGKTAGGQDLLNPPQKLMDFYIIYDYHYEIYCPSVGGINDKIPIVKLPNDGSLEEIKITNYYVDEKNNITSKKIKRSKVNSKINDDSLTIKLDQNQLKENSIVEISAQIKSRNFVKLTPSISNQKNFKTTLTVSYPNIFNYVIPVKTDFELTSNSTSPFELLTFQRDPGPGNGTIDKLIIDSKIFKWNINHVDENNLNTEFELNGVNFPPKMDIGIMPFDIIKIN